MHEFTGFHTTRGGKFLERSFECRGVPFVDRGVSFRQRGEQLGRARFAELFRGIGFHWKTVVEEIRQPIRRLGQLLDLLLDEREHRPQRLTRAVGNLRAVDVG